MPPRPQKGSRIGSPGAACSGEGPIRPASALALSALNYDQFSAWSPASGPHRCKPTAGGLPMHLKVLRFGIWSKRNTCG